MRTGHPNDVLSDQKIITLSKNQWPHKDQLMLLRPAVPNEGHGKAQQPRLRTGKKSHPSLRNFATLEQACSPEYQGAQGAFKDSMIH
jgi:hypothetical protein